MTDPVAALIVLLRADPTVSGLVTDRIYWGELPRTENTSQPQPAIVLKPAGGGLIGGGYAKYGDRRVDVFCYGETLNDSWLVYAALRARLKQMRAEVWDGTALKWARESSGGVTDRDPRTQWPLTLSSWQVLAAEPV